MRTGQGTVVWFSFFFFFLNAVRVFPFDSIVYLTCHATIVRLILKGGKEKYLNGPVSFADTADNNKTTLRHTSLNRGNNSLFFSSFFSRVIIQIRMYNKYRTSETREKNSLRHSSFFGPCECVRPQNIRKKCVFIDLC